jgi:fatty-acid peroxygenase
MSPMPRDPALDSTFALLREGYDFIWNRCRHFDSDLFETRIMGQRTVCIHGPEAARVFYDESKFQRTGALPRRVVTSLFGKHAIHTLDGDAHRARKAAFLGLMTPNSLSKLMDITADAWRGAIRGWEGGGSVVLFDEAQRVLTEAVCHWAGVPLRPREVRPLARDLGRMVDSFGGVGPRLWIGKLARMRRERWAATLIQQVRGGSLRAEPGSALDVMAHHREADGSLLSAKTAAVELLNVLRPTAAVAWYITFAALALHRYPQWRERIAHEPIGEGAGESADLFMQEVRRFYPFTPYLGARVRQPFQWRDCQFAQGTLVLLDVHGNDHDPRVWQDPEEFKPERFRNWSGSAFDFIPQGGGDHARGHRCPGEWITMHNITLAVHLLTRCITYEVAPEQDLSFDRSRLPTRPRSGFVVRDVRLIPGALESPAPRLPSPMAARAVAGNSATPSLMSAAPR